MVTNFEFYKWQKFHEFPNGASSISECCVIPELCSVLGIPQISQNARDTFFHSFMLYMQLFHNVLDRQINIIYSNQLAYPFTNRRVVFLR